MYPEWNFVSPGKDAGWSTKPGHQMSLCHGVARGKGGWERRPGEDGIKFASMIYSSLLSLPVHVREFTIWCVWRGVGMRVGHPRLVQPDQRELFQIFYFYNGRGRLYNQGWF